MQRNPGAPIPSPRTTQGMCGRIASVCVGRSVARVAVETARMLDDLADFAEQRERARLGILDADEVRNRP
jgi:hypothetical protein